jgi:pimeloyl-ACP methyl ester carboxylesterase
MARRAPSAARGRSDAPADPPVLFLTGVGLTAAVARRWIAELRPRFRVLSAPVDGVAGASTQRAVDEVTVESAMALLDATAADRAHVVGMSFGGVVAQEIAIRYPTRVCSLVLGATSAGGERYVSPDARSRRFIRRLSDVPVEEGLWAAVPYLYAAMTRRRHAPLIGQDIAERLSGPLAPRSYRNQRAAARAHDASARLEGITAPTLVIHGELDRIVPVENGRLLAEGIPGATLTTLRDGAHAFPTDAPAAHRELVSFLLAHSRRRRRPAASRTAREGRA